MSMNVLTRPEQLGNNWKGTCCEKILSQDTSAGRDFYQYLKECFGDNASIDAKNRFHYYVKSYMVSYLVGSAGFNSVFHVGFGGDERYARGYGHFDIDFFGCELPSGALGSWYKSRARTLTVIEKDFLELKNEDFSFFREVDRSKLIFVTEATLYYFFFHGDVFDNRHSLIVKDKKKLTNDLKEVIAKFSSFGVKNFLFIEPRNTVFEEAASSCNLAYSMVELSPDLKYDFLMHYTDWRVDDNFFPVAHILTDGSSSIKVQAKRVLGESRW